MKAFWTYTLARVGVFAVTYAAVWLIASLWIDFTSLLDLWVLVVALVLSSLISVVMLAGLRERLALNVQQRAERMTHRIEESRSAEDVD